MCCAVGNALKRAYNERMLQDGTVSLKVWAYIVREHGGEIELLVFEHVHVGAGIQIPGGTVEPNENIAAAVEREVWEESGIRVDSFTLIQTVERIWNGTAVRAHLLAAWAPDKLAQEWIHKVTGSGEDSGMRFRYYWLPRVDWNLVYGDFKLGYPALNEFIKQTLTVEQT